MSDTLALSLRTSGPYTAANAQTDFAANFPAIDSSAIGVLQIRGGTGTILAGSAYSVVDETDNGFTLRLAAGATAGDTLFIFSELTAERDQAYGSIVRAAAADQEAQRLYGHVQELRRDLGRALRSPVNEQLQELPPAASRASNVLGFDSQGRPMMYSAGASPIPQHAWTTVHAAAGAGTTDLGAVESDNIFLDNPDDHAINHLGEAPSGTTKNIVFTGTRGTALYIDNDHICGPNAIAYGAAPTQFITGTRNLIEGLPGDHMRVSSLGPASTDGLTRWQILSYTPNYLVSYGQREGSGGNSLIPPEINYAIGPIGPGLFPWVNGMLSQWQTGIGKTILGGLVVRGGGGTNGAQQFQMASDGSGGGATLTGGGVLVPIQSADIPFGVGSKISFTPFIPDPANPGQIRQCGNDIGFGAGRSPSYIYQGDSVVLSGLLLEAPTKDGVGGCFLVEVAKPATTTRLQRMWCHGEYGNLVLAGAAAMEAAHGSHGAWPYDPSLGTPPNQYTSPAKDCDFLSTPGWGNLSVVATDITDAVCGYNAAIAVRLFGAHTEGLDIGSDVASGNVSRYGVHAGVRIEVETYNPTAGVFTYPQQPRFSVRMSADTGSAVTGDGTAYKVAFDASLLDAHHDFDLTNHQFVAPVAGDYELGGTVSYDHAGSKTDVLLEIVTTLNTQQFPVGNPNANSVGVLAVSGRTILHMAAGNTAFLRLTVSGGSKNCVVRHGAGGGVWETSFSGRLIG